MTAGCAIPNCSRSHYGRGWCSLHYQRWLRTGSPTGSTRRQRVPNHGSESEYTNYGCRCDLCRVGTMRARALRRLSAPRAPGFWDLEARRRAALSEAIATTSDDELLDLIRAQAADDRNYKVTRIAERSLYEPLAEDLLLIDRIAAEVSVVA